MSYITSKEIIEELQVSRDCAITIIRQMPHIQIGEGKRCILRVHEDDWAAYKEAHTVQPGVARPRPTPYETEKQRQDRELEEYHAARRSAKA